MREDNLSSLTLTVTSIWQSGDKITSPDSHDMSVIEPLSHYHWYIGPKDKYWGVNTNMRLWTGNNRTIFPFGVFKEKFLETQSLSCLSGRRQVKTFVICLTDCCLTWSTWQTRHLFHFITPLSTFVIPSHQRWLTCWALFEQTWNKKSIFYLCKLGSWLNILHNTNPDNNLMKLI